MIFASNHLSFSDSIFLPLVVPRKMTFLAKADYFTGTGLKGRLTKMFFTGVGQLPVDRSGGRASSAALDAGLKVLRAGDILGLYPEGTRSPDGRLYKGQDRGGQDGHRGWGARGAGRDDQHRQGAAHRHGDPEDPARRHPLRRPLDFSRYAGLEEDRFVLRSATDEIMYALMELSGQEYVDMYAAQMKDSLKAKKAGTTST